MTLGEEARGNVRAYQARTGLSVSQIGRLAGYAHQTMRQFMAGCYPCADNSMARQVMKALEENPPGVADVEGRLYTTQNVRILAASSKRREKVSSRSSTALQGLRNHSCSSASAGSRSAPAGWT